MLENLLTSKGLLSVIGLAFDLFGAFFLSIPIIWDVDKLIIRFNFLTFFFTILYRVMSLFINILIYAMSSSIMFGNDIPKIKSEINAFKTKVKWYYSSISKYEVYILIILFCILIFEIFNLSNTLYQNFGFKEDNNILIPHVFLPNGIPITKFHLIFFIGLMIILGCLGLISMFLSKLLNWVSQNNHKNREKNIGVLGFVLLCIGFFLQSLPNIM